MNGISVFLTIALSLIVNLTGASFAARKVSSLEKNKSNYVEHKCGEPKPQFYYISNASIFHY